MATLLKQSTTVDVGLGPFVDSTDGVTAETALTISQADVRLKKNGGAWAQKADTNAATHEENGWYEVALNTTDTDTPGILLVAVNESGALPVWREFLIVPANVYDSLVSGSDALQVHTNELSNSLITAAAVATDAVAEFQSGLSTLTAAQVNAEVDTALADAGLTTTITGRIDAAISSRLAGASYTTPPTANENADALLDRSAGIETGLTPRQAFRLMAAALAGKLSGAATTTIVIRNAVADSKARITATVDADGNRSAITTDLT